MECVVIGPEDPLANGFADMFMKIGISTVGPVSNLAQIEKSKGFTRELLSKYGIDCCNHSNIRNCDSLAFS